MSDNREPPEGVAFDDAARGIVDELASSYEGMAQGDKPGYRASHAQHAAALRALLADRDGLAGRSVTVPGTWTDINALSDLSAKVADLTRDREALVAELATEQEYADRVVSERDTVAHERDALAAEVERLKSLLTRANPVVFDAVLLLDSFDLHWDAAKGSADATAVTEGVNAIEVLYTEICKTLGVPTGLPQGGGDA